MKLCDDGQMKTAPVRNRGRLLEGIGTANGHAEAAVWRNRHVCPALSRISGKASSFHR